MMRRSVDDWAEDLDRRPVTVGLKLLGLFIGVIVVVCVALWGFGVISSPFKGKGDAYQEKNTSENWVAAQRAFHQEKNDYDAYLVKIAGAKDDVKTFEEAHPQLGNGTPYDPIAQQDGNLHTTLQAVQQQCVNVATQYNTDSQSYLTQDFKDAGLPESLDLTACR
jgi:hypothetical protein